MIGFSSRNTFIWLVELDFEQKPTRYLFLSLAPDSKKSSVHLQREKKTKKEKNKKMKFIRGDMTHYIMMTHHNDIIVNQSWA